MSEFEEECCLGSTCRHCNGEGVVDGRTDFGFYGDDQMTCRDCNGTGEVICCDCDLCLEEQARTRKCPE